RRERVEARVAVRPEIHDARHHEGEERREEPLQVLAEEEVLLPRLADDRRGQDRVAPAVDALELEDRIVGRGGVVAVVIPERPFEAARLRRDAADERGLRVRDEAVRRARRADEGELLTEEEGCEEELRYALGQRRRRGEEKRRRAAQEDGDG